MGRSRLANFKGKRWAILKERRDFLECVLGELKKKGSVYFVLERESAGS